VVSALKFLQDLVFIIIVVVILGLTVSYILTAFFGVYMLFCFFAVSGCLFNAVTG